MIAAATANKLRYGTSCVRCGSTSIAPEGSAHANEHLIHHKWLCEDCELSITTAIRFRPDAITPEASRISRSASEGVSA